nr:hypothetical protein [Tanacetum cinerariifolium]
CSIMDAPPSPNHVFNFPKAEFEEDPQEEPEEEVEEDPEKGPEEDLEAEAEDDVPPSATPLVGSPITPLPFNVQYLERCEKKRKVDMETCSSETHKGKKRIYKMEQGLGDEMQFSNRVEHRVTDLENSEKEKD